MKLDWLTSQQGAELWNITGRRVQALCADGRIDGVIRLGCSWLIPKGTPKPEDGRKRNGRKPMKNNRENEHG
jgi:hypothetical protein